jgi:hypothetical protein
MLLPTKLRSALLPHLAALMPQSCRLAELDADGTPAIKKHALSSDD